jgi:hypothetical protein
MNGATGTDRTGLSPTERELGVALRLLLEGHRQHPLVATGGDEVRTDDSGRATHRSSGVHAEHRLVDRAEGVGEVHLGLHDTFEQIGCLAEDDGVDVAPVHVRVLEGALGGLTDESGDRDVTTTLLVVGLADADNSDGLMAHSSPSRMHTRFCWRHGPDVA